LKTSYQAADKCHLEYGLGPAHRVHPQGCTTFKGNAVLYTSIGRVIWLLCGESDLKLQVPHRSRVMFDDRNLQATSLYIDKNIGIRLSARLVQFVETTSLMMVRLKILQLRGAPSRTRESLLFDESSRVSHRSNGYGHIENRSCRRLSHGLVRVTASAARRSIAGQLSQTLFQRPLTCSDARIRRRVCRFFISFSRDCEYFPDATSRGICKAAFLLAI
jgi:hypothetical protein